MCWTSNHPSKKAWCIFGRRGQPLLSNPSCVKVLGLFWVELAERKTRLGEGCTYRFLTKRAFMHHVYGAPAARTTIQGFYGSAVHLLYKPLIGPLLLPDPWLWRCSWAIRMLFQNLSQQMKCLEWEEAGGQRRGRQLLRRMSAPILQKPLRKTGGITLPLSSVRR